MHNKTEQYMEQHFPDWRVIPTMLQLLCPFTRKVNKLHPLQYLDFDFQEIIVRLALKNIFFVCAFLENGRFEPYNCLMNTQKILTESGVCFSYNQLPSWQLYRDDV